MMEKNRTRDREVTMYGNGGPRNRLMPSKTRRVVYSSLELMDALPPTQSHDHPGSEASSKDL